MGASEDGNCQIPKAKKQSNRCRTCFVVHHLRLRQFAGCKFRRQRPIGPYIVDFICLEKKLVIEVDGGQHSTKKVYDNKRTSWLQSEGFTVLRFWDHEVLTQINKVKQVIWNELHAAPSLILPRNGGEED